jgi:hypothetical protein
MKHVLLAALLAGTTLQTLAADVGVSVRVGEPSFYGRIDIGDFPRPRVIYDQPVVVQRGRPGAVYDQPLYLRVPPGHEKHWQKHCHRYNACARPVFFVEDRWYNDVYVVEHRRRHDRDTDDARPGDERGRGHGKGRGPDR